MQLIFSFPRPKLFALAMVSAAVLVSKSPAGAQSDLIKPESNWEDHGFGHLPKGFPTDDISLFEGLNNARGSWSYEAETNQGETAISMKGTLTVAGNPKGGMLPAWNMVWSWPRENPQKVVQYSIMASPRETGFEWMMFRIGPLKNDSAVERNVKIRPTMFQGKWDFENRTVLWTESDLPNRLGGRPVDKDSTRPKQSFEMMVSTDGRISIQNSQHSPEGHMVSSRVLERKSEAPAESAVLVGKHQFKSAQEILDERIRPWLPPRAKDITILSERGGHFARYKVAEADLLSFLDELWKAQKDSSAHERESMSGEGEPANMKGMADRFKVIGWEPLEQAITYYGPSKSNGAMTTYYYDRATGIAYHDRGYW